ncbi:CHR24 [Symbiodinium pilosum]|uniref:CHR24 protein n=1 Tax=Symbiodinium pilosum TaxID=2952 RepID=A0A812N871_SYMPI|nr:CHR24 [Symbiodinium pilosum]
MEDDEPHEEAADASQQDAHQIVAADGGIAEQWSGTLPPEAAGKWEISKDVCRLSFSGSDIKLPRSVYDRLYHYQRQGVVWMWNLYHKGFGGILADEMGLGKTVQTAAFLACLKFTDQGSRFLVVVPVTLLEQWRRELAAWAQNTGLAVHVMHGALPERRAALRGHVSAGGVLLISYDLARTCIHQIRTAGLTEASASQSRKRKRNTRRACRDDDSPSEEDELPEAVGDEQKPWDVLIVDEGHQIKNPSSQSGRVLRRINARSRILLTGTPLQNKLSDLWALMDFAQPALLGNHATFERNFSDQIAKGSKRNASRFAVELKDHLARELKRLTAPHFLRRLKCEVACTESPAASLDASPGELPPKMDVVLWLNLTPAQLELYNLFLTSELVSKARGGTKCGMEALRCIAMLKKLCGHPLLCLPQDEYNVWRAETLQSSRAPAAPPTKAEPPEAATQEEVATQEAPECHELLPRLRALLPNSAQGAALLSTKLRVLSVLLPQLQRRGHRCLIFSQSVRMLDLIQGCVLRVLGLKFLRIDGSIDPKDRDLKLQKFQQEDSRYFALCLSMQVGGTGLTVTGANRVILVDPAWNPSADAQAIDRVHRIGQKREVVVYRLIGSGAIEDKMFRLQIFKGGLSKTFMEHEQQVRFFTHQQLKSLFEPPSQSASTQSLLAEQIGTEALEHEDLLRVVAADVGSTDDPQALAFWQSSDVLGFSDYQRLFMFLEQADSEEQEAVEQAKELAAKLKNEEYVKDQVVQGKWRGDRFAAKENVSPQVAEPLKNA